MIRHHIHLDGQIRELDGGGEEAETRSGSRSWLCNSERLQGAREIKYVQFQRQLRGTGSARKALWTGICEAHSLRRGPSSLVVVKRKG